MARDGKRRSKSAGDQECICSKEAMQEFRNVLKDCARKIDGIIGSDGRQQGHATQQESDNVVEEGYIAPDKLRQFKTRLYSHELECNVMIEELESLALRCGRNKDLANASHKLCDAISGYVTSAWNVLLSKSGRERLEALRTLYFENFLQHPAVVMEFGDYIHESRDVLSEIFRWIDTWRQGIRKVIDDYQWSTDLEICCDYIYNELFAKLDAVMKAVIMRSENIRPRGRGGPDSDIQVPATPTIEVQGDHWLPIEVLIQSGNQLSVYKSEYDEMEEELAHLAAHLHSVGGDKAVVIASEKLREELSVVKGLAENIFKARTLETISGAVDMLYDRILGTYLCKVTEFRKSLYGQKHAFYFSAVSKWEECLQVKRPNIRMMYDSSTCANQNRFGAILESLSAKHGDTLKAVGEELRTFREKSLPVFLADEKERTTTRYINITTIATFFSSVTATMLQFSLPISDTKLGSVVNFFWFLSLVFSVSSGISSLLGMTWRKSPIYDSGPAPLLIKLWLDKAPLLFLAVAAVLFVIGLNLFVYIPGQSQVGYVSLSTNAFTGVHSLCLVTVTCWFIYQLKHDSTWAKCIRTVREQCTFLALAIYFPGSMPARLRDASEERKHLLRNVYWALGFDTRVLRLDKDLIFRRYPEPFIAARCIRWLSYPTRMALEGVRSVTRAIARRVNRHRHGDTEERQSVTALDEYRNTLEITFNDRECIKDIVWFVDTWTSGRMDDAWLKWTLEFFLWGYPKLVGEAFNPRLAELRRQNIHVEGERRKIEERRFNAHHASLASPGSPATSQAEKASRPVDTEAQHADSSQVIEEIRVDDTKDVSHSSNNSSASSPRSGHHVVPPAPVSEIRPPTGSAAWPAIEVNSVHNT